MGAGFFALLCSGEALLLMETPSDGALTVSVSATVSGSAGSSLGKSLVSSAASGRASVSGSFSLTGGTAGFSSTDSPFLGGGGLLPPGGGGLAAGGLLGAGFLSTLCSGEGWLSLEASSDGVSASFTVSVTEGFSSTGCSTVSSTLDSAFFIGGALLPARFEID